ncbi:MAG: PP-loop domain protein [Desulfomicrobiaceae bacterium]|jgi:tRNA(Ile)-lysidine synthase TilS/MesJ|nr:PP-loop domain protein [Desulfomicrobiaceae bacterium]MDI3493046.1 tRNA 2-thiocytidine biosynthesis protein TtcA [Desulfomicrobiaceae bacterium]
MAQWGKLHFAQERCLRLAGKAMQRLDMTHPGARIGIAASGGVDSWVLLHVLLLRQRILPFPVELMILHLNPGFAPENHAPLVHWARRHGVACHVEVTDFGPRAHSSENRKNSPCFYCAHLRRKRLFTLCRQYNLTHLAMGHTADDLTTTFFLNLVQTGKVYGLMPKERYFGGQLTMIRPLILVEKKLIRQAARKWNLPVWENPCPSKDDTARSRMLDAVRALCQHDPRRLTNVFQGLQRWQMEETLRSMPPTS